MMLNTTSTAGIVLNISSLIGALLTGVICLFILSILLRTMITNRDVVFILAANSYLALIAFSIGSVITNIDMVKGDFKWFVAEETFSCRLKSYTLFALLGVLFNTFALQAIFRLFRVVYSSHIWLQYCRVYIIIIPIMWFISFLLVLPLYIWHDIRLVSMENACFIHLNSIRGFIWSAVVVYGLPMNIISMVYFQLIQFMRRSTIVVSTRTKRDVTVVRRIILVISVLMLIGLPSIVLELMLPFTDVGKPLFYRISNITMIIAMIVLSFMLVYITPQIKEILIRMNKRNQVVPLQTGERPILPTTTAKF